MEEREWKHHVNIAQTHQFTRSKSYILYCELPFWTYTMSPEWLIF